MRYVAAGDTVVVTALEVVLRSDLVIIAGATDTLLTKRTTVEWSL